MNDVMECVDIEVEKPKKGMLIIGQSDSWIHRENNITGTLVGYYADGVFRSLRGKEVNGMRKWVEFKRWKWKFILFLDKFCNA